MGYTLSADEKFCQKTPAGHHMKYSEDDQHQHRKPGAEDQKEGEHAPHLTGDKCEETSHDDGNTEREKDALQHEIRVRDERDLPAPAHEAVRYGTRFR
jgi:hypothetical protein